METTKNSQTRERNQARLEIGIWDALIGAHGSPAIQKFAIQQRLYAFTRTALNISCEDPKREMRQAHNFIKKGVGKKLKQFIDFIEGELSLEEALKIKNALQAVHDVPAIQLASA